MLTSVFKNMYLTWCSWWLEAQVQNPRNASLLHLSVGCLISCGQKKRWLSINANSVSVSSGMYVQYTGMCGLCVCSVCGSYSRTDRRGPCCRISSSLSKFSTFKAKSFNLCAHSQPDRCNIRASWGNSSAFLSTLDLLWHFFVNQNVTCHTPCHHLFPFCLRNCRLKAKKCILQS